MKTLKITKIVLLLLGLVVFNACVQDDEFNTPNTGVTEPNIDTVNDVVSINSVLGELIQANQGGEPIYTFEFDEGIERFVEGFVISSDEGGNFFEEFIIQNAPENPTNGLRVLLDVNPLFVRYEVGRKVFIKLNGLTVGFSNGVLTLGVLEGIDGAAKIPAAQENDFIFRSPEVADLIPLPVSISDFSDDKTNLLIELQDVQFSRNEATGDNPLSFASEPSDQFDGDRTLESCASSASVVFSTSTFADFKGLTLPSGRGSMNVILTKDFFGEVFNVVVNSPEDINFDSADRCDPDFLECTDPSGGGAAIFQEDFEGFGTYTSEGWDNINISGTDTDWFISSFSGNFYSRISAFGSDNNEADVWLVTPEIDLSTTEGEELSFDVQANFDNGTNLSVWISTDYAGDPTTATWSILDATIPTGPAGTFGNFESVGPINISCVEGTAVVGFLYEGSDPSATTRYHLDNVIVTGN
ncbi:DUF5689 domain-containing protein [uncultured Winogradskyella sp.]|uniref:DUF5689 domain-containing protein n=1 Tax=uncultured Winogradskyella sp. TaxID=395353 RepID=UPI0026157856|nr:DUF5689 domain-containing protein [uncultured Winogradskyella sp.]